jgi:hypothetical protein
MDEGLGLAAPTCPEGEANQQYEECRAPERDQFPLLQVVDLNFSPSSLLFLGGTAQRKATAAGSFAARIGRIDGDRACHVSFQTCREHVSGRRQRIGVGDRSAWGTQPGHGEQDHKKRERKESYLASAVQWPGG